MKFNINNFLLAGLLVLIFYLFTLMGIAKLRDLNINNPAIMENVILYILGIISGVVGDKTINGNGKLKE